jgi:hypothetical protein
MKYLILMVLVCSCTSALSEKNYRACLKQMKSVEQVALYFGPCAPVRVGPDSAICRYHGKVGENGYGEGIFCHTTFLIRPSNGHVLNATYMGTCLADKTWQDSWEFEGYAAN